MRKKISFIGSGNVATHLAIAFDKAGFTVHQIISSHKDHAFKLAKKFGSYHSDNLKDLYEDIDYLIIAVSDDAIPAVAREIELTNTIVAHTSGAVPMEILSETSNYYGVFYPLQSFSTGSAIDMRQVPVLVEGSTELILRQLDELAFEVSNKIVPMNSEDRKKVHLAAVLVNNFTNHLFYEADRYLGKSKLPFDILLPLIQETVSKLDRFSTYNAQTGPARRGDHETINRHLAMLKDDEELAKLYAVLSRMIEDTYKSSV